MKLYSGPLSLFTAKVRIALAEKALSCELVSVPFSRARGYEPKHPEVLRLNPKAQVPVLVDGDLALYDSTIILEYLEEHHPEPPLYPRDVVARARCRQLEAAADEVFFPHVLVLIREIFYEPEEARRSGERIREAREALAQQYGELDGRLARAPYLCGEAFTVADIGYFLTTSFATNLGAAPDPVHANLQGWLLRLLARPSIRAEAAGMAAYAGGLAA